MKGRELGKGKEELMSVGTLGSRAISMGGSRKEVRWRDLSELE